MQLTWRQRLEQQPSLLVFREWPVIDALSIPAEKRRQFLRNQQIVAQVLANRPMNTTARDHHVSPPFVTYLLNRALGGEETEVPALTRALVPGEPLASGRRRKALSTLAEPCGNTCSFRHLLAVVPGLRDYLDKLVRLSLHRTRNSENLRVGTFHKAFLRYLRQANWPADTYPFTVDYQGYESLRRYFHRRMEELSLPRQPTRVITPRVKPVTVFAGIQIDEHTVDCHGSVVLVLNERWEPLRLSRITLIAAREVTTGAVLGSVLVLNGSVSREDVLALLATFTCPWTPLALTAPGLAYPPGVSMPSALGAEFRRAAYGIIQFDNAMVHRALEVRDYVCDRLGATLNLGIPKYPLARVLIETAFKDLNLDIHRFRSTTGSHPTDPLKEPPHQAKKPPLVSIKVLEEVIQVHMAVMNRRPMGNLGAATPIDVLREQMANHWVPLRPACALERTDPQVGSCWLTVHYSVRERRRPWVNFAYLHYDAPGVLSPALARQKIRVEYQRSDIRHLHAYNARGEFLGTLEAPQSWQRFPHSLATRKLILKLIRQNHIRSIDPLGAYFDYILQHRTLPSQALELVRVTREFGQAPQLTDSPRLPAPSPVSAPPRQPRSPIPDWSPGMIDHRRHLDERE